MKKFQLDPILYALLQSSNTYISGEKLAQKFGITRSAIHKKIEKLRQDGYQIQANKGFLLQEPFPYQIIAEKIQTLLTQPHPLLLFTPSCDSTNTLAKELLPLYQEPFVLIARGQKAARGRMNRVWQMHTDHDIAFSFAVPCVIQQQQLFSIIRLASLAVHQVLSRYSSDLLIKWPNDIIHSSGRKICGILTESILEDSQIRYLIIGIGINVNSVNLPDYAISLKQLLNISIDINQLYSEIITNISVYWSQFPKNISQITKEWENTLAWIGQEVSLEYHDQVFQGKLKSVSEDGSLILLINNQKQTFFAGDLSSLKIRKY